jgi:hypothetical protein
VNERQLASTFCITSIISDWVLGHLSGFALVHMDKIGWIQIYGLWKEGTDPMNE